MPVHLSRRARWGLALTLGLTLLGGVAIAESNAISVNAQSFKCLQEMTPVRGFFVDNIAGNLDGTLKVANSESGGVYPPGSVVQLIPNEAMVKHEPGFSPATHDWEFFELDVTKDGSVIRKRGLVDVQNRFNGNCFGCHVLAKPQFDLICEENHGCQKLPIGRMTIKSLQKTDPRCKGTEVSLSMRATAWVVKLFTGL